MEAFMKSQIAFVQNQEQTLNNHSQAISRLEIQMSQLASSLSERPKGTLPNQPKRVTTNLQLHLTKRE